MTAFRYIAAITLALAGDAHAAEPGLFLNQDILKGGPQQDFKGGKLYHLKIRCKADGQNPLSRLETRIRRALTTEEINVAHFAFITKQIPKLSADPNKAYWQASDLPKEIVAMIPGYAKRGKSQLGIEDYRNICTQSVILDGLSTYYLVSTEAHSSTHSPSILLGFLFTLPNLVPPIWSLFFNAKISPSVQDKLTQVNEVKSPLEAAMSSLNTAYNWVKVEPLKVGTFEVKTKYSRINVTVEPVTSLLKAGQADEIDRLLRTGKFVFSNDADVRSSCEDIAAELKEAGHSEDDDIPFALTLFANRVSGKEPQKPNAQAEKRIRLAAAAMPTPAAPVTPAAPAIKKLGGKERIIECLGKHYLIPAAKLKAPLWNRIIKARQVSVAEAEGIFPPDTTASFPTQPNREFAEQRARQFMQVLTRIAKNPTNAADTKTLASYGDAKVELVDNTDVQKFPEIKSGSLDYVAKQLAEKGLLRFGCPVLSENGRPHDGGIVSILAFEAGVKDTVVPLNKSFQLRPVFEKGKIVKLHIWDNGQWAKDMFASFNYWCGGIQLDAADRPKPSPST